MSDIYKRGLSPQTRAISSSRNRLFAVPASAGEDGNITTASQVIGVVSSFNPSDSRTVETVRGIGFGDQIAELVPGMSEAITISINRTALYQMNIFQALGYKGGIEGFVRALKHHRWPFDLRQEIVLSEDTLGGGLPATVPVANVISNAVSPESIDGTVPARSAIATLYAGCWIESYNYTSSADNALIAEDVTLKVTDIFAYTSNIVPVTAGFGRPTSLLNKSNPV